jgi:sugar (pentulose or hexulose) kinase
MLIERNEDVPIYVGGGAMRSSDIWPQIMADAFDRHLYLVEDEEVTARGLAALMTNQLDVAKQVQVKRQFEPRPNAVEAYQAARERQTALYNRFYASE